MFQGKYRRGRLGKHFGQFAIFSTFLLGRVSPVLANDARSALPDSVREVQAFSNSAAGPIVVRRTLNAAESAATMPIEVGLRLRNVEDLRHRVAAGEKIAGEEMARKYLPRETEFAQLREWLRSSGLEMVREDPARLSLFARAPVSRVAAVFDTAFGRVRDGNREYSSAISVPSVPDRVRPLVLGINGLQPHLRLHKHISWMRPADTAGGAGYTPQQIQRAYNMRDLGSTGSTQTIAIVIDAFPLLSDLSSFWTANAPGQTISRVTLTSVDGGPLNREDADEATLDAAWSGAMAPGAEVNIYGIAELTPEAIDHACSKIYEDTRNGLPINQVSMSFGGPENEVTEHQNESMDQYFLLLASAGIAVFVSSGDAGSNPDKDTFRYNPQALKQPEYPASDPNVTAVGGTSLELNADGSVASESAWSDGGGTESRAFRRPDWQTGHGLHLFSGRLVPDVAAAADPAHGCALTLNGQSVVVGGTSWSAPVWAGFTALLNESRIGAGLGSLGFLSPRLYAITDASCFRDITMGNNGGERAAPGYDLCTGLGVPNGARLWAVLSGSPSIAIAPANQKRLPGQSAAFVVTAKGAQPLTYQWQWLPIGGSEWLPLGDSENYRGTTTSSLTVNRVSLEMNGDRFRCLVGNRFGNAVSLPAATLLVPVAWTFAPYAGHVRDPFIPNGPRLQAFISTPVTVGPQPNGDVYVQQATAMGDGTYFRLIDAAGMVSSPSNEEAWAHMRPFGQATDSAGNVYEANPGNEVIYKTAPGGEKRVLAGGLQQTGYVDGPAAAARFGFPTSVAIDSAGNVYVTDRLGYAVRRISPDGQVSTVAGSGSRGTADGIGINASFTEPTGIVLDGVGNLYVSDGGLLREINPNRVVTTIAGGGMEGEAERTGTDAWFWRAYGLAFDVAGNLYVADRSADLVRKGWVASTPVPPADTASRLINISARAHCTVGNGVTIGGFVVAGPESKRVLIRAVGPTLVAQGLGSAEVLANPVVEVHHGATTIATNDNWEENGNPAEIVATAKSVGAQPLAPDDHSSSALVMTLAPGVYTFIVKGKSDTSGIVLLEVYDADPITKNARFVNIATRAHATDGNGVAIGGFVIRGSRPKQILIRAVGPTLASQGIGAGELLANPTIELHYGDSILATNDDWASNTNAADLLAAAVRAGATPLDAADSRSSALLVSLRPGAYTFLAKAGNGDAGIVLVEVYDTD